MSWYLQISLEIRFVDSFVFPWLIVSYVLNTRLRIAVLCMYMMQSNVCFFSLSQVS